MKENGHHGVSHGFDYFDRYLDWEERNNKRCTPDEGIKMAGTKGACHFWCLYLVYSATGISRNWMNRVALAAA